MKKKTIVLIAAAIVVVALIAFVTIASGQRKVSFNVSYIVVAQQLQDAGYAVTVITDAEELSAYEADGMQAAVIAYKGGDKLDTPDEEKLADYLMVELFYFETEEQAKTYYNTEGFQFGYQAWSDAYYHIGISNFNYRYTGNIAYAGVKEALDLCK